LILVNTLVRLRLVEEQDLPLLVSWRNTPTIWANFFNKFPLSTAGQRGWFASLVANQSKKLFIICAAEDDEPIGTIGLDNIDFANQSVEFGNILIGKQEYVGKGYATEATRLMLSYCFSRLNMNRVYLVVYADNARAINLYERCGFKVEGTLREAQFADGVFKDVLAMSILRREFR
jgi:RimJ/RimL family protein N-acetyltransferase